MKFFLGTHQTQWLYDPELTDVPLFVSNRRLARKPRKRVLHEYCIDSGGFSELSLFGKWVTSKEDYVTLLKTYMYLGHIYWAAPQDWMCEPIMIAKTGKTILEHQKLTIDSVVELRQKVGKLIIPVLQGWHLEEYLRHVEMYKDAGFNLQREFTIGVGSVCRRQGTNESMAIFEALVKLGLNNLHGFGLKLDALRKYGNLLLSSDSMAWSYDARCNDKLDDCTHLGNCANCKWYAIQWRLKILKAIEDNIIWNQT